MFDCPFCDVSKDTPLNLAYHVINTHRQPTVGDRRAYTYSNGRMRCWCGEHLMDVPAWNTHMSERGGMAAHVLEVLFHADNVPHL